jgi:hypothetical protein
MKERNEGPLERVRNGEGKNNRARFTGSRGMEMGPKKIRNISQNVPTTKLPSPTTDNLSLSPYRIRMNSPGSLASSFPLLLPNPSP